MTKEERQLLLKDLCARVPYGVKVAILGSGKLTLKNVINSSIGWYIDAENAPTDFSIDEIKPYLRQMSSMTEEENISFQSLAFVNDAIMIFDWLHSHHFDCRGLIPKGLALEAPEGMYN